MFDNYNLIQLIFILWFLKNFSRSFISKQIVLSFTNGCKYIYLNCFKLQSQKNKYDEFNQIVKPDCINIDADIDPLWAKEKLSGTVIQGGMNPNVLLKDDKEMLKTASKYIQTFKDIPYIFNLGHGLLPETDPAKVEKLVKFYRNFNG